MKYTIFFYERSRIQKICTMLKYMSLTTPLERIDRLKNSVESKTASKILYTILMDSEWMSRKDENKNTPFFPSCIKCEFDYNWNHLFDVLCAAYSELKEKKEFSLYTSNYTGGYYGEVYQSCSSKNYTDDIY